MKNLQIFRTGRQVASNGKSIEFTDALLSASAAAYDPAKHEAPLVVGHPKTDAPAYGWVNGLSFREAALEAAPHQVDAQFAEMVRTGRFKKISASFYEPDCASNPVPGVYYLRHVGFLGAQPPAVKGLKAIAFAESEPGVIEFTDWDGLTIASLFRKIKNLFIDQYGQDKADAALPEHEIENLQMAAATNNAPAPAPAYNEPQPGAATMKPEELAAQQAQLKADNEKLAHDRAEFAEREAKLAASEAAAERAKLLAGASAFVDTQVSDGRVLPAHRDGLVAFMASLPAEGVLEFGEGDKAVKTPAAEWLRAYITAQPKVVEFKERAAPAGVLPDATDANAIANAAVEFQEAEKKAGREISVSAAVKHITQAAAK